MHVCAILLSADSSACCIKEKYCLTVIGTEIITAESYTTAIFDIISSSFMLFIRFFPVLACIKCHTNYILTDYSISFIIFQEYVIKILCWAQGYIGQPVLIKPLEAS